MHNSADVPHFFLKIPIIVFTLFHFSWVVYEPSPIGGSRGPCPAHAPPPFRTQFFHFRIHIHQKAPASEVEAPPTGHSLRKILDPPLQSPSPGSLTPSGVFSYFFLLPLSLFNTGWDVSELIYRLTISSQLESGTNSKR